MTLEDVKRRVQEVRDAAGDDEAAHSYEDKLYRDVLTAIPDGVANAGALAAAALETVEIGAQPAATKCPRCGMLPRFGIQHFTLVQKDLPVVCVNRPIV